MSWLCCISFIWQCSRKCGSGLRKRTVLCTSTKPGVETRTLPDSLCAGLPKPGTQESCFIKRCQKLRKVQWFVSTWQEVRVKKEPYELNIIQKVPQTFESYVISFGFHHLVFSDMRSWLSNTLHQVCGEGMFVITWIVFTHKHICSEPFV